MIKFGLTALLPRFAVFVFGMGLGCAAPAAGGSHGGGAIGAAIAGVQGSCQQTCNEQRMECNAQCPKDEGNARGLRKCQGYRDLCHEDC